MLFTNRGKSDEESARYRLPIMDVRDGAEQRERRKMLACSCHSVCEGNISTFVREDGWKEKGGGEGQNPSVSLQNVELNVPTKDSLQIQNH